MHGSLLKNTQQDNTVEFSCPIFSICTMSPHYQTSLKTRTEDTSRELLSGIVPVPGANPGFHINCPPTLSITKVILSFTGHRKILKLKSIRLESITIDMLGPLFQHFPLLGMRRRTRPLLATRNITLKLETHPDKGNQPPHKPAPV